MPKTYQKSFMVRMVNGLMRLLLRLGAAPGDMVLLGVKGRTSGKLYTTPVTLVAEDGRRWLIAPYGEVSWVQNARAAGRVTLSRGGKQETLSLTPLPPEESAPVLKKYLAREPITQPYFDAKPDSPTASFLAEAARHPVFRLSRE
jgi:deazaflavin-dependent oxidoreductase (nitroreductase family)